jgi:hypothetical protein
MSSKRGRLPLARYSKEAAPPLGIRKSSLNTK